VNSIFHGPIFCASKKRTVSARKSPQVPYADVFQPVVIALERYLDYPPVGAIGAGEERAKKNTRENKMKPTNPNAHTYVNGTDVKTHGYAVTHNTFLQ